MASSGYGIGPTQHGGGYFAWSVDPAHCLGAEERMRTRLMFLLVLAAFTMSLKAQSRPADADTQDILREIDSAPSSQPATHHFHVPSQHATRWDNWRSLLALFAPALITAAAVGI